LPVPGSKSQARKRVQGDLAGHLLPGICGQQTSGDTEIAGLHLDIGQRHHPRGHRQVHQNGKTEIGVLGFDIHVARRVHGQQPLSPVPDTHVHAVHRELLAIRQLQLDRGIHVNPGQPVRPDPGRKSTQRLLHRHLDLPGIGGTVQRHLGVDLAGVQHAAGQRRPFGEIELVQNHGQRRRRSRCHAAVGKRQFQGLRK
jgi:hypothetical protein